MKDPILTLKIRLLETYEVVSDRKTVRQILFSGQACGAYFQGDILPGAVDTQIIETDGRGILNARYTLRGTDSSGAPCLLYIDNTASLGESLTRPKILTDSTQLAWMNDSSFSGFMRMDDGCLTIEIREEDT